jgi:3'-phosphoadenosine 5'-phosphosulfate sulfotransferase (PAPS reductase)/FAD synthetase
MQHITDTLTLLEQVFAHHQKVVLWLSGGKDSTVLLHLARQWAPQTQVLSVIMDNGFSGVQGCVEANCAAWGFDRLQILTPPISFPQYVANFGWPSQLIPTSMDGPLLDPFYDGGPKLSSWWHCSVLRVIWPLAQATQECQADAVLTASRKSDAPEHARIGAIIEAHDVGIAGWTRYDLLHQWTTQQIWDYIEQHQITLPPLYTWKRGMPTEMPDCIDCPFSPEYMAWAKGHTPEVFQRIWTGFKPALDRMRVLTTEHLAKWDGIEE